MFAVSGGVDGLRLFCTTIQGFCWVCLSGVAGLGGRKRRVGVVCSVVGGVVCVVGVVGAGVAVGGGWVGSGMAVGGAVYSCREKADRCRATGGGMWTLVCWLCWWCWVCGGMDSRTAVGRCGRGIGEGLYWWTSSIKEAANAGLEAKICVKRVVGSGGVSGPVSCVNWWWCAIGVVLSVGTEWWGVVNAWGVLGWVSVKL